MNHRLNQLQTTLSATGLGLAAATVFFLSGCSTPPEQVKPSASAPPPPPPPQAAKIAPVKPPGGPSPDAGTSLARSSKDYRKDAAGHLYGLNASRIYQGRLPPMLEAVGVLNVDIDPKGAVKAVHWMRAPRHAPKVMAEIERMVKAAAPYPAPRNMESVTYTDVWLWHKSGKFQLDTLTEGQD